MASAIPERFGGCHRARHVRGERLIEDVLTAALLRRVGRRIRPRVVFQVHERGGRQGTVGCCGAQNLQRMQMPIARHKTQSVSSNCRVRKQRRADCDSLIDGELASGSPRAFSDLGARGELSAASWVAQAYEARHELRRQFPFESDEVRHVRVGADAREHPRRGLRSLRSLYIFSAAVVASENRTRALTTECDHGSIIAPDPSAAWPLSRRCVCKRPQLHAGRDVVL